MRFDWLDFTNQGHKFLGFIGQSYLKIIFEPIRTQNLGSLLMKVSQLDFDLVHSYLISTVKKLRFPKKSHEIAVGRKRGMLLQIGFDLFVLNAKNS